MLVVRDCGPRGYPGMPEVANVALPKRLLLRGVRDMVRICDGRMCGTAYGTVVLHVAPEAAAGGPLALVRTGDWITLDVPARTLTLEVSDEELTAAGRGGSRPRPTPAGAGPACTPSTCCRPTQAPTWTSSSAPAAMRCHATRTRSNRREPPGVSYGHEGTRRRRVLARAAILLAALAVRSACCSRAVAVTCTGRVARLASAAAAGNNGFAAARRWPRPAHLATSSVACSAIPR